jgi:phenylalanyl-tRNA synthetase beta chain
MNVSFNWLRAFVPFDETVPQLRALLTSKVATVDEVISLRDDLSAIVVARVVEEGPHPDSDHLHVTKVDAGTGELLDVVCGAPNVTAGKLYPFAMSGTVMPSGLKIEKRKIRGAVSNGMICSARELGLGEDHDGVMELSIDVPPGTPFLAAMPVGDTRLVIDVGANRPDLLSHLGVAREVAAITGKPMALPRLDGPVSLIPSAKATKGAGVAGKVSVTVEDDSLVRRFMGVVIRGVKVGPSPQWLVDRLAAVGSRSINNVVDASNYVLHEMGQPTHAFDLAKLAGGEVRVRLARPAERLTTLDGADRSLATSMIVIADRDRPQAIAGVMGGQPSEVSADTRDLFIEVANFDPSRVRSARRTLGMTTDASYRFERGVDVELAPKALERVAQLIVALAGGAVDGLPVDLRSNDPTARQIALRTSRVVQVLGARLPADEIDRHLKSIGFTVLRGDKEHAGAAVPSWRSDVVDEIDLIEEIARLHGYDAFPDESRAFRPTAVPDDPQWIGARRVRDLLVGHGLFEVRPTPFVRGVDGRHVRITNPLAESEAHMRRELIETLVARAEFNLAHMQGDIRLFEIGNAFAPSGNKLPLESLKVGVLVMGRRAPRHFTDPAGDEFDRWAQYDRWDLKALASDICREAFPDQAISIEPLGPGATVDTIMKVEWGIVCRGSLIGRVGRIALDAPVWAAPAWGIEIELGVVDSTAVAAPGEHSYGDVALSGANGIPLAALGATPSVQRAFRPLPVTPAAEFDLALVLAPGQSAAEVEGVIRVASGELLEQLEIFDQYVGEGLGAGMRSVAWRLTFRHPERTLRDKEIEGRRAKILSALEKELNVRPRTS